MKACMTCHEKPIKSGTFKAELQNFADKRLPVNNKKYYNKDANKIKIFGLEPNKTIFYFATSERDFTKTIESRIKAYGNLENSGVSHLDEKGDCYIYLHCPQLYINSDDKVYSRHFHYLYWDDKKSDWNKSLFTQQIICNVDNDFLLKYMKKSIVIDARLLKEYKENHIENAISMPYNKKWTTTKVFDEFKKIFNNSKLVNNKLVPIIIYCNGTIDEGIKLYKKLNKLGFYNTVHIELNL